MKTCPNDPVAAANRKHVCGTELPQASADMCERQCRCCQVQSMSERQSRWCQHENMSKRHCRCLQVQHGKWANLFSPLVMSAATAVERRWRWSNAASARERPEHYCQPADGPSPQLDDDPLAPAPGALPPLPPVPPLHAPPPVPLLQAPSSPLASACVGACHKLSLGWKLI